MHVKKINGRDSYFIGKRHPLPDESHESTEAKDQNDDSFLEFLDGIKTPVKGTPSHALNIDTEDADSSRTSEIDFERPVSGDYVSIKDFKRLQVELDEFKRFSHGEILSLKAQIANRPSNPSQQTKADSTEKDREALLRCLQDRIVSLERQLYDKQKIIEGLLERPRLEIKTVDGKKGCLDDEIGFIPSGKQQLQKTKEPPNINTIKTKRLNKSAEVEGKQTEQSYMLEDKASQKPRNKGKKPKSQILKYQGAVQSLLTEKVQHGKIIFQFSQMMMSHAIRKHSKTKRKVAVQKPATYNCQRIKTQ